MQSFEVKRQQYDMLAKQVDKLKEEAAKFGSSTVDIEMLGSEPEDIGVDLARNSATSGRKQGRTLGRLAISLVEHAEAPSD